MRLYFKNGVEVNDEDILFISHGDVFYLDLLGKDFGSILQNFIII